MAEEKHFGPVWFIPGANKGRYPFCNSVYVESAGVVIDPGSDRERLSALAAGPGVRAVWLSHWHEDHFMHLDLFDHLPFCIHEDETPPLTDPEIFMDWYGIDNPEFRDYWRQALRDTFHYKPRKPAQTFAGVETVDLGGLTVEVIHVPGHTPGHLAFFFKDPRVLFMSDYDLTPFGPWYGDRDSSIEDTIESVERLRELPARVWLTGHEGGVFEEFPAEQFDRYLAVVREREEKLLDFLREPRAMDEIVNQWIVYRKPREPRAFFEYGEKALMTKHLERLKRAKKVAELDGRYRQIL